MLFERVQMTPGPYGGGAVRADDTDGMVQIQAEGPSYRGTFSWNSLTYNLLIQNNKTSFTASFEPRHDS
jgi:hypothetical protein